MRISISILGSLLLVFSISLATTIHVPGQYPTIQAGIDAAVNGDTVLVAAGTYQEHLNYYGKGIVVISEDGPEVTIIERRNIGISLVTFANGEPAEAELNGFTIQYSYEAVAVYVDNAHPRILNNRFLYNSNPWLGGAISVKNYSGVTIEDNFFWRNGAFRGGAIDIGELIPSDARISRNIFIANTSQTHGGAVFVRNSSATYMGYNIFYMNYTLAMGGAVCLSQCKNIKFFNNTVAFNMNYETWNGCGLVIWYTDSCDVYNNIFAYNVGMALRQEPFYTSSASYNAMWDNTVDYVNITPGQGSITLDPLFVAGTPYSFELTAGSPCIDAGDPNSPLDPDSTIADMGALFYFQGPGSGCEYVIGDVNGSGDLNGLDVSYGVSFFKGGPLPPYECECTPGAIWYVSGDVNTTCNFNGLDVTYLVAYFKGGLSPEGCSDCLPTGLLSTPGDLYQKIEQKLNPERNGVSIVPQKKK